MFFSFFPCALPDKTAGNISSTRLEIRVALLSLWIHNVDPVIRCGQHHGLCRGGDGSGRLAHPHRLPFSATANAWRWRTHVHSSIPCSPSASPLPPSSLVKLQCYHLTITSRRTGQSCRFDGRTTGSIWTMDGLSSADCTTGLSASHLDLHGLATLHCRRDLVKATGNHPSRRDIRTFTVVRYHHSTQLSTSPRHARVCILGPRVY